MAEETYKVEIYGDGGYVEFVASSPVSESRVANYEGYNIVHLPTSLWAYRNTNGRHFSITGKLVSRTKGEAVANAGYLTTVRRWVLPGFGSTGSTPPIVFLNAYGNKRIKKVPCVVLSYNWTFPDDVDYIFGVAEPMPVIGILTIELEEAYSAEQITNGDWKIDPQSGGEFSYVGEIGNGSTGAAVTVQTTPSYGTNFMGIASGAAGAGFPTLGGLLTLSPSALAKLPMMAAGVVGAATNNPLLSTVAQEAVGLLNNRFVSGTSPQTIINNSSVSTPPFVPASTTISDAFGRLTNNLSIPSFFGGG